MIRDARRDQLAVQLIGQLPGRQAEEPQQRGVLFGMETRNQCSQAP